MLSGVGLATAQTPAGQQPSQPPSQAAPKPPAPKPAGATGTTQATTPTGTAGRAPGRTTPVPVKTTSVRVTVRDPKGDSLDGVRLLLSGSAEGEYFDRAAPARRCCRT